MIRDRNIFQQEFKHSQGWWNDTPNIKLTIANNLNFNQTYVGWDFTTISTRYLYFVAQFSHEKVLNSTPILHVHWMPTTTNAGNVKWNLEYYYKNEVGDTAQGAIAAGTAITTTATVGGTAYVLQVNDVGPLTPPAAEQVSAILTGRLYRDGGHIDDTYGDTCILKDFDAHFQIDQPGSFMERTKWGG